MVKFGTLSNPIEDIIKEIKRADKLGFDFIEIGIEPPMGDTEILMAKKEKIKEELEKRNLFALGHTFWICELGSTIEELRRVWIEESKTYVETAHALGIKLLNFHAHSGGLLLKLDESKKHVIQNMIDSLEEIISYAKSMGIQIMLENMPRKDFRVSDFKKIMEDLPDLGMHLDVAHAYVSGGMKEISKFIKTFKDRIVHVHISDNHGEEDEHIGVSDGSIDFEKVVKELKKINYDKTITFEVFTNNNDLVKSREIIKKIWNNK